MNVTPLPEIRVPEVKICGLTRRRDAQIAAEAGAAYLGVVLVPGTPRAKDASEVRDLTGGLGLPTVAVVANAPLEEAVRIAGQSGADILQLHGEEPPDYVRSLKEFGPWAVWKAVRVRGPRDLVRGVESYGGLVQGILLDSWHPLQQGGTGTQFSWADVEKNRSGVPSDLRLVVAGGLFPGNVEEAIRRMNPDVVDVSSGVEVSPGIKDPEKIRAFFRNAGVRGKEEGK